MVFIGTPKKKVANEISWKSFSCTHKNWTFSTPFYSFFEKQTNWMIRPHDNNVVVVVVVAQAVVSYVLKIARLIF